MEAVVSPLDKVAESKPNEYTTQTGVRLRLRYVSATLITKVEREYRAPKPPKVWIEPQQGIEGYWEENIADPDYADAIQSWQMDKAVALFKALAAIGTTPLYIPEDIVGPDDDSWIDDLEELELVKEGEIPRKVGSKLRYFYWLSYIACGALDFKDLTEKLVHSVGGVVTEEAVQQSMESFSDNEDGDSDNGVRPTPISTARLGDSSESNADR